MRRTPRWYHWFCFEVCLGIIFFYLHTQRFSLLQAAKHWAASADPKLPWESQDLRPQGNCEPKGLKPSTFHSAWQPSIWFQTGSFLGAHTISKRWHAAKTVANPWENSLSMAWWGKKVGVFNEAKFWERLLPNNWLSFSNNDLCRFPSLGIQLGCHINDIFQGLTQRRHQAATRGFDGENASFGSSRCSTAWISELKHFLVAKVKM